MQSLDSYLLEFVEAEVLKALTEELSTTNKYFGSLDTISLLGVFLSFGTLCCILSRPMLIG